MKKFIHSTLAKMLFLAILGLAVCGYFVVPEYYKKAVNTCLGLYHVYRGDKAYSEGNLKNALKYYHKALVEYPEHSQARCNLADIYVSLEDYPSAIEEYRLALKYKPDYMVCRMHLGKVHAEDLSEYDEAIIEYKKVTTTNRRKIWIPFVYNNINAIKLNKGNAFYNMGLAYRWKTAFTPKEKLLHNQYLAHAIESYKKALKINKNDYDTLYNLAVTYHLSGNPKEAGLTYCKAIEVKPLNYEAHVNLAILLDGLKYHKEAIAEFNKAGLLLGDKNEEQTIFLNDLITESHRKQLIRDEEKRRKYIFYEESDIKRKEDPFWIKIFNMFNDDSKIKDDKTNDEDDSYTEIKGGHFHLKMESDREMHKRMKECESKKIFKGM